jgi:putative flavoprotein involved in K+ transport
MRRTEAVIIGGGQAGLAMSRCLVERGLDHVVLERGAVAQRWRAERWSSLRLLTPNWLSRLPGFSYSGPDPDGYMTSAELVAYLEAYARSFAPPVETGTTVVSLERDGGEYRVVTDRGAWRASQVVIATGHCDRPFIPAAAARLSPRIAQLTSEAYRDPAQLPPGGVLVVGASSTGIQWAEEVHRSGRNVTLAVGRHTRMRRRHRGRDILWWLDAMGVLRQRIDEVYDPEISRAQPSFQLVGREDPATLDLPRLQRMGVRLNGRLEGAAGVRVRFADDLVAYTASADVKLASLLARIEAFAEAQGLAGVLPEAEPFAPFLWPDPAPAELDLETEGIRSVLWATGYRRSYPWLKLDLLDERGELRQRNGLTPAPGLYTLGLHFQRQRNSSFLDGVGDDARFLAEHVERRSGRRVA